MVDSRLPSKQMHLWLLFFVILSSQLISSSAIQSLRFASPLQALTIWDDKEEQESTPRKRFLPVFQTLMDAERQARKKVAAMREARSNKEQSSSSSEDWSEQAARLEARRRRAEERYVERESLRAASEVAASQRKSKSSGTARNPNQFQFVGVINPPSSEKAITWYARKKPADAKWSVRLVHANRDAIITDLVRRGKADIFAKYENTGQIREGSTSTPVVESKYSVRERSWRNLWNFSPKHFFTDSSGMYWRERRLRSGLYTDGNMVYEASYRYSDGRNGMHRLSSFQKFLASDGVSESSKKKIQQRLKSDSPDVVVEE